MKLLLTMLLAVTLLSSCEKPPKIIVQPDEEARRRVLELESQLQVQRKATDRWELFTGSLGVACIVALLIGTALGSKTRHDATLQS
jgi:hypothetical protein